MTTLLWILAATLAVSALSLTGAIALFFKEEALKRIIQPLVAFSAGALLGGAFLHLLPEAAEKMGAGSQVWLIVILGFSAFFLIEQFIHWHHCHRMPSEHRHPVTYLVLISDGIHNFLDGLAVGAAFMAGPGIGVAATLAVAMHEIPQELGDFGIMIHGGWKKSKALLFNFLSGLTMVLGGLIAWSLARDIDTAFLLPFAAGNFIYIAASDLIPEIKHSENICKNGIHFFSFALGIALMYLLGLME
ncbi:MAG: ZIP family metal transporter [Candidatus Falkowbacteria bacterium]